MLGIKGTADLVAPRRRLGRRRDGRAFPHFRWIVAITHHHRGVINNPAAAAVNGRGAADVVAVAPKEVHEPPPLLLASPVGTNGIAVGVGAIVGQERVQVEIVHRGAAAVRSFGALTGLSNRVVLLLVCLTCSLAAHWAAARWGGGGPFPDVKVTRLAAAAAGLPPCA